MRIAIIARMDEIDFEHDGLRIVAELLSEDIRVNATLMGAYALSGALAGLAGVFMAIQTYAGSGNLATGYELSAIASVVVGGTLSPFWQDVVRGAFLLVVILLQNRLANRKIERA